MFPNHTEEGFLFEFETFSSYCLQERPLSLSRPYKLTCFSRTGPAPLVSLLSILPILTNKSKQIQDESQPKGKFWPECVVNFAQLRRVLQPGNVETAARPSSNTTGQSGLTWSVHLHWPLSNFEISHFSPQNCSHFPGLFSAPDHMMQTYAVTDARREFKMRPLFLQ